MFDVSGWLDHRGGIGLLVGFALLLAVGTALDLLGPARLSADPSLSAALIVGATFAAAALLALLRTAVAGMTRRRPR
jgi:hypothetical protein